jgi:polyisoprenoid-binding protein YceI
MQKSYKWIILLVLCVCAAHADPLTFKVGKGGGNLIQFESKAPLETITGVTDQVEGTITLDPRNLADGVSALIIVDAASLKTGNRIRDGHMRDNHLHTDKFPKITFAVGNAVLDGALQYGVPRSFQVVGDFYLHGVTRTITVPVQVTLVQADAETKLRIQGTFSVRLSDYEIPRPQFLVMKLDEVQNITVDFWGAAP